MVSQVVFNKEVLDAKLICISSALVACPLPVTNTNSFAGRYAYS